MKHRTKRWVETAVGVALPAFVLLVGACRWGVPADPGLNARLRARPAAFVPTATAAVGASSDAGAAALYAERCGRCHAPYPPSHAPASRWPALVARYGPRAGLFGEERARVLDWLMASAGR